MIKARYRLEDACANECGDDNAAVRAYSTRDSPVLGLLWPNDPELQGRSLDCWFTAEQALEWSGLDPLELGRLVDEGVVGVVDAGIGRLYDPTSFNMDGKVRRQE